MSEGLTDKHKTRWLTAGEEKNLFKGEDKTIQKGMLVWIAMENWGRSYIVLQKETHFYDGAGKVTYEECYNVPLCNFDNVKDDIQESLESLIKPQVMEQKGPSTGLTIPSE